VGIAAATLGDNIGYWIGRKGGRPLLERYTHLFRIPASVIEKGENVFAKYGSATVFFARFVFGMRIIAGPMAGVLRMDWKKFSIFNFLGAALWVTVISIVGYKFGEEWESLVRVMGRVNLVIGIIALWVGYMVWRAYRARKKQQLLQENKAG
jgi:membrane-associated protein